MNNPWVELVTCTYWAQRLPQLERIESTASYTTDERDFYARIEPRVTFAGVLRACSPEWWARKGVFR